MSSSTLRNRNKDLQVAVKFEAGAAGAKQRLNGWGDGARLAPGADG